MAKPKTNTDNKKNKKLQQAVGTAVQKAGATAANKVSQQTQKKQTVKKQSPKQSPKQNAKVVAGVARNAVRNAGTSTKKATTETVKTLPKKQAKPFKASDLSGNTGRGVTKQARKQTKSTYTSAIQRKAEAKQKEKDIKAGKYNVPNRLGQADEMMLSQEGKNAVNYYKDQWEKAKARGDKAGMQKAHEEAEKIRLTNPATVKTTTYEGPTQSQVTMAALQQYAQAMQAGDEEGMRNAKNLAAYAMLNVPKDNREQRYMTGAYSGGTWGDRALEASESDILKNQKKNLLKSEGAALASAVPEAAGGYIETVMNAPDIRGGSSQLVVKDPNVDKRTANQFDLRGQSRYTEEDARAKADHYQAQAEYLKQIAYSTTPLPGVAGRFAVDATAAAGGMGIDLAANTIVPGAGLVSMGARTFGSSVQQAKDYQKVNGTDNDPYADAKAYLYGAAIAGTEIASEKMFGGPFQKIYGRGFADAAVKGATKPTIGKTILKGLLEEGSEEVAADIAQWQAPRIYGGETETLPEMLKGAAYDFTLGAALGGLGGAVTAPGQVRAEKVQNLRKRMEAAGYAKDDIDTAFQRMTVGDMEELTDSPDSTLEAWVDTVIGRTNKSSQIELQSLTEASGEQSSEQTFEGRQEEPAPKAEVSRGKAWDALRSRLRESGVRDAQMLRTIRDRMSVEEMQEAANLRKNDFLEWRDRVTSPDYQPAPMEEAPEPTENITAEEELAEGEIAEEEEAGTDSDMVKAIAEKLMAAGVAGPEMTKAIAPFLRENNATEAERVLSMSEDEVKAWARGEAPAKPSNEEVSEMLREQEEMLAERREREPKASAAPVTGDAALVNAMADYLGDAGRSTMIGRYDPKNIKDASRYVLETRLAYNAGFTGNQISRTMNRVISPETANRMYEAGVMDKQAVHEQRRRKQARAKFYNSNEAGLGRDANGHYLDEYVENLARQSAENARILDEIDRTSKAFGTKVLFPDAIEVRNKQGKATETAGGGYTQANIMLDKDLGKALEYTYGHELTHRMAEIDPNAYEGFKKYVMSRPDSEKMYTELQYEYNQREIEADHDLLVEETCAEFSGAMISQADMLKDFAKMADQNIVQRFFQALRDMARKLTGRDKAYVERAVKVLDDAYRERYGVSMNKEMREKTRADVKAVGEMYESSLKQARKMSKNAPISSVIEGNVFVDNENNIQYSVRAATHDIEEGEMLEDLVNAGIMTRKEAEQVIQDVKDVIEYMLPFADIVDWGEEYTRESRPFSPIKPNSDPLYVLSIDFSTNCRKRLIAGTVIERLQVEAQRALSAEDQIKIRDLLAKYREMETGFQIACAFCYVESARLKTPEYVNEFLDNKEAVFRNYFAQKSKSFKAGYDKMVGDYKESKGKSRTSPDKELPQKQRDELTEMKKAYRQNYKLTPHEQELLDKAMNMPAEAFLTEKGLTNLVVKEPEIYDVFINKVRSASHAKPLESYVPLYYGDIAKNVSKGMISKFNDENGFRTQSWSDWQVQNMLDEMVAVIELSILGGKMLKYTKFPEVARIFGGTGIMFNMSGVVMATKPIYDEDGEYSIENFDVDEGVNILEALEVRDMYPDTVGIQCIGNTIEQTKALLRTDWVDYVIPYHKSGMSEERRKAIGIDGWNDHEDTQQAKPIDAKAKPGPKDDAKNWHKEPKFSEIMVWNGKDGLDCMRKTQKKYLKMCKERGLTPAFPEYVDEPNYWKLLIERKMINHKTGKIIRQQPVRPIFNKKEAFKAIDREVREYDPTRVERAYRYVKDHLEEVGVDVTPKMKEQAAVQGNTLLANFVNEPPVLYSIKARDSAYLQAVRDGDMETAQRMVDEAAKEAGFDSPKLYHGTYAFGFTGVDTKKSIDGISFFATNSTKTAGTYSGTDVVRRIDTASDGGSTLGIYQLYANTDGMIELDAKGADSNHIELGEHAGEYNDYSNGKSYSMYATAKQIAKFAKKRGYSGVIIRNVIDTATPETRNEGSVSDVYVFLKPRNQVKSADPITYDDEGNIIPLSERFDPNKPDIRWALRGGRTVEELAAAYGIIPPGERRAREVRVPQRTEDDNRVSRAIRTIMEAQTTPEQLLPRIEEMIANGEFSYSPITNKESVAKARATINDLGYDEAWRKWSNDIDDRKASSDVVTLGWILYDDALKDGNVDKALEICAKMARFGSQLGQAVQAMSILKRLPTELQMRMIPHPRPKHVQDKIDEYENDEEDWEEEDDVFAPDEYDEETGLPKPKPKKPRKPREKKKPTQEEVDQMEEDTAKYQVEHSKITLKDKWDAWRYLAMLFNLRTHDRNIVGNLGFAPIVMSKNLTATVAEIALYNTFGKNRGMQRTKSFYGINAFHYAWNDYIEMRPIIMGEMKWEGQEQDKEHFKEDTVFRGILAPIEKARKLNSALLDMEDSWFSRPQYANALAQFMAANGITVEMMETGVGRIEKGPHKGEQFNGGIMSEARRYAVLEAQKATYRDLNNISKLFMRLGKVRDPENRAERFTNILVEGIFPFRKTPANILCRSVEYSPAGFANGMWKLTWGVWNTCRIQNKVEQGKPLKDWEMKFKPVTVAEALDRLCSGLSGTGIFILGMYLAKMGLLVAKGDDGDDNQYYFDKLLGHQQWALEIFDYSVTIDWLAPEVVPLFMGAQYFTSMSSGNPIRNVSNMLDSATMILDPVMELSCLSGIQETLNNTAKFAEGDLNTMTSLIASMGLSYLTQGVPTLFGQLERVSQADRMQTFATEDPDAMFSEDWQYQIGKISAKIPGKDFQQVPYIDSWGNTETETNLFKRIVANMLNPAYIKKIDTREVNKELQRLYDVTGDGYVFPKPVWKSYNFKDENGVAHTYYLTEDEWVATSRAKGRESFDLVQKFMNSKAYKDMSDPDRADMISDLYSYADYKASKAYIHNYRKELSSATKWIEKYEAFSDAVGGYDVISYKILDRKVDNVTGVKKNPTDRSKAYTTACAKLIALYDSGADIPTDPEKRDALMEALDISPKVRNWNRDAAKAFNDNEWRKLGVEPPA